MQLTSLAARILALVVVIASGGCSQRTEPEAEGDTIGHQRALAEAVVTAGAVDASRLANASAEPEEWFTSGRDAEGTYYSPLTTINDGNVGRLGFAWDFALGTRRGLEATPIVVDGVMYFSGNWGRVYALDARTGASRWSFDPQVDGQVGRDACCDVVNRGIAVWRGKVYVAALDGRLIALDAGTGRPVWSVDTIEKNPRYHYTTSGTPQIAGQVVVIGNAGADLGARGYLTAYDLDSGAQRWRFYTVPHDPRKGPQESPALERAAQTWDPDGDWSGGAGGTAWDGMAYDRELGLVYVGTGNGAKYNARRRSPRGGDNLYLASIIALDAATGEMKWFFQQVPAESWDYTATQKFILADLAIDGRTRKVIMQAPKNGFFYVLDRATGELISARNHTYVNWTKGLDPRTGRPTPNPAADHTGTARLVYPSMAGAHTWAPMAFNPKTGLVYIPTIDAGFVYIDLANRPLNGIDGYWDTYGIPVEDYDPAALKSLFGGLPSLAELARISGGPNPPRSAVSVRAWDPIHQRTVWQHTRPGLWQQGGVMTTAGNLVISGGPDGYLDVYAADDGRVLKRVEMGTSLMAAPMTYAVDGVQYVAVLAGYGGGGGFSFPPDSAAFKYGNAGRVVALKLDGGAVPKPDSVLDAPFPAAPARVGTPSQVASGERLYNRHCARCHVFGRGLMPDLRRSPAIASDDALQAIVLKGALRPLGMASFSDVLSAQDVVALRAYLVDAAHAAQTPQ
jgi:quinohemoprotein ethanol dehydrogenase